MARNKIRVYLHFVWATWDRHPLITEDIARRLYPLLSGKEGGDWEDSPVKFVDQEQALEVSPCLR
jgi:hypothetical protein